MKIEINKHVFSMEEAEYVNKLLNDLNENEALDKEELDRMAEFYIGRGCVVIDYFDVSAVICRNTSPMMEYAEGFNPTIDTWIRMFIVGDQRCRRVGFYLNDFYMLDSDNRDDVMRKAYIINYSRD